MLYIYVLDYATDSIYEIKVEDENIETFTNEDAEKVLIEKGFKPSEVSFMTTESEQDKISMVYSELINKE